ncbi:KilA-N domain-containing protein, partial [Escherichia coli]
MPFYFRKECPLNSGYLRINATDIAKRFGKRLDHWLSNAETLEYVRALDE